MSYQFYKGQQVVCVEGGESVYLHSRKRGSEKIVAGDVYIVSKPNHMDMGHDSIEIEGSTISWCAFRFAPIDEQFKQITLTKVLETETPLVSAN